MKWIEQLAARSIARGEAFRWLDPPRSWMLHLAPDVAERIRKATGRSCVLHQRDDRCDAIGALLSVESHRHRRSGFSKEAEAMARRLLRAGRFDDCAALLDSMQPDNRVRRMAIRLALSTGSAPSVSLLPACDRVMDVPLLAAALAARDGGAAALAYLKKAESDHGSCAMIDFLIGHVAVFVDKPKIAVAKLSGVLKHDPLFGEARAMRALAYEREGEAALAINDYLSALNLPYRPNRFTVAEPGLAIPSRANVIFRLVALLVALGRRDEALDLFSAYPSRFAEDRATAIGLPAWHGKGPAPARLLILNRRGIGDEVRALAGLALAPEALIGWHGDHRLAKIISACAPRVRLVDSESDRGLSRHYDAVADGEYLARLVAITASDVDDKRRPGTSRVRSPGNLRIALGWRSYHRGLDRSAHDFDVESLTAFRLAAQERGAELIALQPGARTDELNALGVDSPSVDLVDDLTGVNAILQDCDGCIATPMFLSELAGLTGVPTFQLIRFPAGFTTWRFGDDDGDRLWPNLRCIKALDDEPPPAFAGRAVRHAMAVLGDDFHAAG